jgi:pyruvate dehydrogenase E1 component
VRAFADQICAFVPMKCTVLGTEGFGRSDIRANLCRFFEGDRYCIAHAAIAALAAEGKMNGKYVVQVTKQHKVDIERLGPAAV